MKLPNFFIVGAAKAGTTSLWRYLLQHPDVFMPSDIMYKEPAYFSDIKGIRDFRQYESLFSGAEAEKMIGEASTAYLTSPESPVRIKNKIPHAKIIIILRNPIDRAYSLYNWMVCNGYEFIESFEQAIDAEISNRYGNNIFKNSNPEYYYNFLYFHSGLYSEQIKRYIENYKREQLFFIIFEEFKANARKEIKKVFEFLNIDNKFVPNLRIHNEGSIPYSAQLQFFIRQELSKYLRPPYNNPHPLRNEIIANLMKLNTRSDKPLSIKETTRKRLREKYSQDVQKTSELIGRDLSKWWSEFKSNSFVKSGVGSSHDSTPVTGKTVDGRVDHKRNSKLVSNLLDQHVSVHDLMGYPGQMSCSGKTNETQNHEMGALNNSQDTTFRPYSCKDTYKVIHLCTQDFGGAGKAAYRLHKGLQTIGIDSKMLVMNKRSRDSSVKVLPSEYSGSLVNCLDLAVHHSHIWDKQLHRWNCEWLKYPNRPIGLEAFTDALSDIKIDQVLEIKEADVINLHWVAGSIDFPSAPLSFKDKHIIWTLHDMNPFTGGCHYSGSCEKYKESCGACPQLGSNLEEDLSRQIWNQKLDAYQNMNINIVTPSQWLRTIALQSKLFSSFPATVIPNGFPIDIFKPKDKKNIRKSLNIPESAKVILFGADSIVNKRKGFQYLLEALNQYSSQSKNETVILTFGQMPTGLQIKTRYPIYNLGSIADENQIALAYSSSDVFVIPSIEDNLPNTVVEAMACGVPVVGFDIGGIPDMIDHKKNGFLARPKDVDNLLEGIEWIISSSDRGVNFSRKCREKVKKEYDLEIQAKKYKALYKSIAKDKQASDKIGNIRNRNSEHRGEDFPIDIVSKQDNKKKEGVFCQTVNKNDLKNNAPVNKILVSAIVSTYNAERFIRGCLEDLENQTIADKIEIIVVDSGSQQDEEAVIKEFQEKYSNIKYIKTDQRETVYAAWNRGIQAATGKYIANANTDDRHRKDALEVMVNILETLPEISLIYADVIITDTENENFENCTPVGYFNWMNFSRDDLLNKGCFMGPQPMWRKDVHGEYGYFDESFVTSGDYEFWLRISQSRTFMHLPVQLGLYLRSPGSIEHSNREKQTEENHKILNMYRKARSCGKIIRRIQVSTSPDHTGPMGENIKSPETIYRNIQAEMGNKQPEETIEELEKLAAAFPEFAIAFNDLGVLYYNAGNREKALKFYENAVQLDPGNMIFQKNLADFYCLELGLIEEALKIYVDILTTHPQDIETLLATGQICVALEKLCDARDFFNRVLEIEPWNEAARQHLEELERPTSPTGLVNAESPDEIYQRLKQNLSTLSKAEAIDELEKILGSYPDLTMGHNDLGVLYYHTGEKEKALRHYQQAAHLQPENITLQKNLADFLFVELEKLEEALQIYVGILTTHPDDVETLLITGHICVALKKFDDAIDFYERVLRLDPDNEDANKNIQVLLDRQSKRSSGRPDSLNDVTVSNAKVGLTDLNAKESENQDAEPKTTVSIVISLNGIQNRVKQCIESIAAHTEESYEIILINNGATKGILKWAQNLVEDNAHYQLVKCAKTYSWAQCLNQVVKAAVGEYIVLMHNDVMVADRWLSGMHQCFKMGSGIGVVGPMTNETSGIQKVYFSDDWDPSRLESDAKAFYEQNQYRRIPTTQLATFCLMFRSELTDKIGDFDAQLVSEQAVVVDFCKRSAAWGFQNLVAGDVFVYHADRHKGNRKTSGTAQIPTDDQKRLKENWNKPARDQSLLMGIQMMSMLETVNELHQKGYIDQAVETLLHAIGAVPEEKRLYLALAEISISLRRYQDAIDTLNEMPTDAKIEMDSEETGDSNESGFEPPSLVVSENCEMKTLEILGYAEEGLENFAAAEEYADRMLSIDPKSARALNLKGVLAYRKKNLKSAEKFFEKSIASDPGAGEPYSNLATLKLAAGKEKEAMKQFEKSFILSPTNLDIATNYHVFISESGDNRRAEKVASQAAVLYPNNRKIEYMLIDFLVQQGKYDKTMGKIEAAIVKFGVEDGILAAALQVREKLGPLTIKPSKKKTTVSCCMIIKDEEKYLARCLASVKPIVDEMIVVDTGSADRSKDIATVFGAQVYDVEWQKDFAKARNFSLEKASGDWILIMDGDEMLSSLDYQHFNQIVKNSPKAPVAYTIVTRNYSALANIVGWVPNDGKYANEEAVAGWIPSVKTRLFYGRDQIWFEGAVHELVDPVVKRKGFETKNCSIPIHHYGRLDKERLERKGKLYFEIGKKKMEEMGDDIFAVREMAIQATTLEKNEMAVKLWQKLISLDPPEIMVADAYINMATLCNRLSNFEQALLVAKKAVVIAPHIKESHYNYALAELHLGNAQATIKVLEELVNRIPDYPPAQFILSAAYFCLGEKEEGFKIIRKLQATSLGPNLVYPIFELAETLIKAHQNEYALLSLGAAIECDIVNKQILELFNKCIQMIETAKNSPERPRPLPLDQQSGNFENLPQIDSYC